jgi:hydrogenase 3 maturation protease
VFPGSGYGALICLSYEPLGELWLRAMINKLRDRIRGRRVVIVGVGNPMRGDDGIGPRLTDRLQGIVYTPLINAGEVPENYLGQVVALQPEVVVIVDAVAMGAAVGDIAILEVTEIAAGALSTHNASLDILANYIQTDTQADVFVLGVQPGTIAFGAPMTLAVENTLQVLTALFRDILERTIVP